MRLNKLALFTGLIAAAGSVQAAPPAFTDARALAMGGTGVASGRPSSASFYNPALLSIQHKHNQDDFNITLPSLNARVADDEDVIGQVDDLQDTIDQFNEAVESFQSGGSPENARDAARTMQSQLRDFNKDAMRADVGLSLSFQKPGKALGVGVFADASLRANARGEYADQDDAFLSGIIDGSRAIELIDTGDEDQVSNNYELRSQGRIVAAAMAEVGLTLSREFEIKGNALALGVSPKFVQLRTFDYIANVAAFDDEDFDAEDQETTKNGFNMDIGAAYTFGEHEQWVAGASIRNLIPMELKTVNDQKVELNPQMTVGMAHRSDWHTLAIDLDLTKNEAFSFEDDTQWLSVGAEVDVFNSAQLRAGARHNIAHDSSTSDGIAEKNQLTAGLAVSPFGMRFELAALLGDGELGGGAELGFMF
ncbi:conjugal transfer protein TraF [Hydrocarboniclastica marina]|uniref:Type IX secretion system membrane protein PorP/SprF n=1 Tax=Hydrocarboniclastica marina TaxID=2259620 RepID=A0A4V1D8Y8_9ALTE|nr:conjugal transfer protein TraF [Hydrocarboniclastica marina]QCF26840.1 type IX secretion system membrane protein PorP/SprF [Hydrocarboniclastica marina]